MNVTPRQITRVVGIVCMVAGTLANVEKQLRHTMDKPTFKAVHPQMIQLFQNLAGTTFFFKLPKN
jgi:hypothetical protein